MRKLNRVERAALWLYSSEYCAQDLSSIEFYKQLSDYKKRMIDQMVYEIVKAKP